jgi:hypothetical protein
MAHYVQTRAKRALALAEVTVAPALVTTRRKPVCRIQSGFVNVNVNVHGARVAQRA